MFLLFIHLISPFPLPSWPSVFPSITNFILSSKSKGQKNFQVFYFFYWWIDDGKGRENRVITELKLCVAVTWKLKLLRATSSDIQCLERRRFSAEISANFCPWQFLSVLFFFFIHNFPTIGSVISIFSVAFSYFQLLNFININSGCCCWVPWNSVIQFYHLYSLEFSNWKDRRLNREMK